MNDIYIKMVLSFSTCLERGGERGEREKGRERERGRVREERKRGDRESVCERVRGRGIY